MAETRLPVLTSIDHWLKQWGPPVWEGIYLGDHEACDAKLAEASEALAGAFSTPDAESAAALYLDFLRTQTQAQFSPDEQDQTRIRLAFIDRLGDELPDGELLLAMWARTSLTMRCLAHHLVLREVSEPQVSDLIEHTPVDDLDHQCLSYLAFWAFNVHNKYYLDYTYRLFLTDPFMFMVDFSRQRIKVMRALVYGKCGGKDIAKLVNLIPHKMHLEWFENFIIPRCQSDGLWTQELALQFSGKSTGIAIEGSKVPSYSKPQSFQLNF